MSENKDDLAKMLIGGQDRLNLSVDTLAKTVNDLVVAMAKKQVEDDHLKEVVKDHNQIIKSNQPVIDAMIKSQKRKEHFYKNASSTWARLMAIVIIVSIAASLGIDTKLLGGK